jgi:hypothetical protein
MFRLDVRQQSLQTLIRRLVTVVIKAEFVGLSVTIQLEITARLDGNGDQERFRSFLLLLTVVIPL